MAICCRLSLRRRLNLLARMHIVAAFITSGWMPFPVVRGASFKRAYSARDENQVIKVANADGNAENFYYDAIGAIPNGGHDRFGDPTNSDSCALTRPLTDDARRYFGLGLSSEFYDKYTEAYDIPVLATSQVSDAAIKRACYVLRFVLADREDFRRAYYKSHGRVVVIGRDQSLHDIPEYRRPGVDLLDFPPDGPLPLPVRGVAAIITVPVTTAPEENLLCLDSAASSRDTFDDVLLKTLAIGVLNVAAARGLSRTSQPGDYELTDDEETGQSGRHGLKEDLESIYQHAMNSGWWQRTNAARGADSYFGEGVQSYFNANSYAFPADGYHNDINTRTKLRHYDTSLFAYVQSMFPCVNNYIKRCNSRGNEAYQSLATNCPESGWYYGIRRP